MTISIVELKSLRFKEFLPPRGIPEDGQEDADAPAAREGRVEVLSNVGGKGEQIKAASPRIP